MSENGEIYTAGKTFTLPPAVTARTNSTSAMIMIMIVLIRTVRGLGEREMQSRLISATIVPLRFCNISDVSYKL